jgi:zinc D-Ala-D-Ala carboxypeptidase
MKLSLNFSLKELTASQTAERKGIDNTPTEEHIENLKLLCENILQPVRTEWGVVSVSSGYRSPELCVAIGSSERSQHARGQAADFECHRVDNKMLFEWITNELDYDQAILEFYNGTPDSGWIHVSYNKDGNRKQKLRAFRNDAGKTQYEEI